MLLEGEDLAVRNGCVMVRTVAGAKPISPLWRRLDANWADPLELEETSVIGTAVRDRRTRGSGARRLDRPAGRSDRPAGGGTHFDDACADGRRPDRFPGAHLQMTELQRVARAALTAVAIETPQSLQTHMLRRTQADFARNAGILDAAYPR